MEVVAPFDTSIDTMKISTKDELEIVFNSPRSSMYQQIFPIDKDLWKYTEIEILLNELDDLILKGVSHKPKIKPYSTITFEKEEESEIRIKIRIFPDSKTEVYASKDFLEFYGTIENKFILTSVGSQGKPLKKRSFTFSCTTTLILLLKKGSSLALFNYLPMLFYPKEIFTSAFHLFVKNLFKFSYPAIT